MILNEMIDSFSLDSQIVFLNICLDSEKDKLKSTIEKYELMGINVKAEGSWNKNLRSYFNISGVPDYSILDKGNVLYEKNTDKAPTVAKKINSLLDHSL